MSFNINKNILFLFFVTCAASIYAAKEIENYDSGKIKVVSIMSNDETGVAAYNKKNVHLKVSLV